MRDDVARALSDLRLTPEGVAARLVFARDLPIFRGHFPDFPVVPGIYLIEGARLLGEHILGRSLIICAIEVAKFSAAVGPDEWVEASAVLDAGSEPVLCDARFRCRGGDAARVKLRLR